MFFIQHCVYVFLLFFEEENVFLVKYWKVLSLGQWLFTCKSEFSNAEGGISMTEWSVIFLLTITAVNRLGVRTVSDAVMISCLLSPFAIATYSPNLDWSNLLFPSVFQDVKGWWCLTCLLFIKVRWVGNEAKDVFLANSNITAFPQCYFLLIWSIWNEWLAF